VTLEEKIMELVEGDLKPSQILLFTIRMERGLLLLNVFAGRTGALTIFKARCS
jgi:hypothetical protein